MRGTFDIFEKWDNNSIFLKNKKGNSIFIKNMKGNFDIFEK